LRRAEAVVITVVIALAVGGRGGIGVILAFFFIGADGVGQLVAQRLRRGGIA
jgi:hypothetical protein